MKREGNPSPKKWVKPILTVLVSGKPEESSLAGCKNNQFFIAVSVNSTYSWCSWNDVVICRRCNVTSLS